MNIDENKENNDSIKKEHDKKTHAQKKAKIVAIVSAPLFLLSLGAMFLFQANVPSAEALTEKYNDSGYRGLEAINNELSVYGNNNGDIVTLDYNSNIIDKHNVFKDLKDKFNYSDSGYCENFRINYDYNTEQFTNDLYFTTSRLDSTKSYNVIHYKLDINANNEVNYSLVEYTNFTSPIIGTFTTEEYCYVITRESAPAVSIVYRLDINNFTHDLSTALKGYIYQNTLQDDGIEAKMIENYTFVDAGYDGKFIYLISKNGFIKFDKDMSYNRFPRQMQELYGKDVIPSFDVNNLTFKFVSENVREDFAKKYSYNLSSFTHCGAAFLPLQNRFVAPTNNKTIVSYPLDIFSYYGSTDSIDEADIHIFKGLALPYAVKIAETDGINGFTINPFINKAIVQYNGRDLASLIDLESEKLCFSAPAVNDIRSSNCLVGKENEVYFYFTYLSLADSQVLISRINVNQMSGYNFFNGMKIIFLVASIVFIAIFVISLVGFISLKAMNGLVSLKKNFKKNWWVYLILLGSLVLLCMFCYYPAISSIAISFQDYRGSYAAPKPLSNPFANYITMFSDPNTWMGLGNTIFFLVFDLLLGIVPPLIFAFFLTLMKHKKVSGVLRTLLFIPAILPGVTGLLVWNNLIFSSDGILCKIFGYVDFLHQSAAISRWSLLLIGFPYVGGYLIFYGAMMNIPSSYYEAAELDGITVWKRFFKIDLPLIRPQIKYILIMIFISSIQNFSRIYMFYGTVNDPITQPNTLIYQMYCYFNSSSTLGANYGMASAYATFIFVILFGITFTSLRMNTKKGKNENI